MKDLYPPRKGFKTVNEMTGILDGYEVIFAFRLKEETIKHYKAIKNGIITMDILDYIKWANELTEEDLK